MADQERQERPGINVIFNYAEEIYRNAGYGVNDVLFNIVITLSTIGCYAMSLAPVVWVLIAEIFPNRIRGAAMSVAVSALWIACFVLTFIIPALNRALGAAGTFWLYAAICFAGFAFVWLRVAETKGKTLERIERDLAS